MILTGRIELSLDEEEGKDFNKALLKPQQETIDRITKVRGVV